MATSTGRPRTVGDVERAARALAIEFDVNEIVVVGSQAILVHRADVMKNLRNSPEIDAFVPPGEADPVGEDASHRINALFGEGSPFHRTHGFFIDGVSASTAILPPDWRDRAATLEVHAHEGRRVRVVAPSIPDLIASKLARGEEKDVVFAALCMVTGLARHDAIRTSIVAALPHAHEIALGKLDVATSKQNAELKNAREGVSALSKGPTNPLADVNAYDALRRSLAGRKPPGL